MDINNFFQSNTFKIIIGIIGAFVVLLFVFGAGMLVGFKKADFSFKWGENYHQNFGGPKRGILNNFSGNDFISGHGVFGRIIKIDDSTLVIDDRQDIEKIVVIRNDTIIKKFQETIKLTDLKVNDYIIVIGEPNSDGQTEAKFIRVLPGDASSVSSHIR